MTLLSSPFSFLVRSGTLLFFQLYCVLFYPPLWSIIPSKLSSGLHNSERKLCTTFLALSYFDISIPKGEAPKLSELSGLWGCFEKRTDISYYLAQTRSLKYTCSNLTAMDRPSSPSSGEDKAYQAFDEDGGQQGGKRVHHKGFHFPRIAGIAVLTFIVAVSSQQLPFALSLNFTKLQIAALAIDDLSTHGKKITNDIDGTTCKVEAVE